MPSARAAMRDVALRVVDGGDDLRALLLGQALVQRAAVRVAGPACAGRAPPALAPPLAAAAAAGMPGRRLNSRSAAVTLGAARQDHRALDDVLELAHVARPGVRRPATPARAGSMPRTRLPMVCAYFWTKCSHEQRDVAGPVAQRRQRDREDVEPVVEILAELAVGDQLLEIAVGRRHHAHVDLDRLGAADALELALLQHAQQLDLHVERQVADLVEEQRAAVGQLEAARGAAPPRR